ncbi:septum formation initiator [candidate division KSB1 bacterium]|nr:MAG: septum formation initiator [candidate division KSB1 bacterium]
MLDLNKEGSRLKLTPLDIKKQEFKRVFRGYDRLEVETFLEMVANEFEDLLNERNTLYEEITTLRTRLKDYQQVEHTLKETLMSAQESVNRARVNTEREANLILQEAELKAEKIVEKARSELEQLKSDLALIRAQKDSLARKLKHLLEAELELIDVLQTEDLEVKKQKVSPPKPKALEHEDDKKPKGPVLDQYVV